METESKKSTFSWEIDNFSERNHVILSDLFSSGGCEWCLRVYPKGKFVDDHLSLFLIALNSKSPCLPGWKRQASSSFVLLNQSGKVLHTTPEVRNSFTSETSSWGYIRMLPLEKLQEEGFLENDKLAIEVYINVRKVTNEGKSTENEMVKVQGFYVRNTQALSLTKIFARHPDVAVGIRSKIKAVKTAYIEILLGLDKTLSKPSQSLSETDLRDAESKLSELTEAGFELDWLKLRLEEVSLEKKKAVSDGSQVQQQENVEQKKTESADGSQVQQQENAEQKKTESADGSQVQQQENVEQEKTESAGAAKVSPFQIINRFVQRFFMSCFSISDQ